MLGRTWLQNGLNETRRDRILRTYVRNTYRYHLHEIYSTLRNEYTDWERGEQSPVAICDGLLSLLGDGQVAAPLLRLALLHSASGGRGYFLHFQLGERPSQRGEEVPYLLGIPLLRGEIASILIGQANYTSADENLSKLLVHYLANFVRRGWVQRAFYTFIVYVAFVHRMETLLRSVVIRLENSGARGWKGFLNRPLLSGVFGRRGVNGVREIFASFLRTWNVFFGDFWFLLVFKGGRSFKFYQQLRERRETFQGFR